jgi:CheY-like chemotaxis protein
MDNINENNVQIQSCPPGKPSILVVTPLTDLGELICDSLKDLADCLLFSSVSKTISYGRKIEESQQAILDMEMGEMRLLDLGRALRRINPSIKIVVLSKEEPSTELESIQPWKFLRKPLLLQDLLVALGYESSDQDISSNIIDLVKENDGASESLYWLNDSVSATRHLASMIEKCSAQEALLIQNYALWSYTGKLSEDSVREVDHYISKSWGKEYKAEYMRYVRLETTHTDHALFAVIIAVGVILALVFDAEFPISKARTQTNELANSLLLPDQDDKHTKSLSSKEQDYKRISDKKLISAEPSNIVPAKLNGNEEGLDSSGDIFHAYLPDHVNDQPGGFKNDLAQTIDLASGFKDSRAQTKDIGEDLKNRQAPEDHTPEVRGTSQVDVVVQKYLQSKEGNLSFRVEPVTDGLYNLAYSFLLIPRFFSHHITKDQIGLVSNCLYDLSITYGWRLEFVDAKQDYLLWEANIPPTLSLSEHIEINRKETSRRLLGASPYYEHSILAGDFWAPGYLILGGRNAISNQVILEYSTQIRQKYGLWRDRSTPFPKIGQYYQSV